MNPVPESSTDLAQLADVGDYVVCLSWLCDGTAVLAAAATGPIRLFDATSGRILASWPEHSGGTFRALCSPKAPRIASVGADGRLRLRAPDRAEPVAEVLMGSGWAEQLAWSPDGQHVAASAGRTIRILDEDGDLRPAPLALPSTVAALAWKADGRSLAAAAYGGIHVWDVATARGWEPMAWKSSLISLAWSPDGRWLAAGTQEQTVQIWELPYRPGRELAMQGYPGKVKHLVWHSGSRLLATDGGVEAMVWDCSGGGPAGTTPRILQGHSRRITAIAYQRAGHLLATGDEGGGVMLWNAGKSTTPIRRLTVAGPATCLAWSPDDRILAVGTASGPVGLLRP